MKTADTHDDDMVITNTSYQEPGRPTVLAKHSAKEEHLQRGKVKFDVANYSQLSIGEVYSGYLSQVNSSRDMEVEMVKQMHLKFEDTTAQLESQLGDLKSRLEVQEAETRKANSKFEFSVSESEKQKASLDVEKKAWDEEKIALTRRAGKVDAALEEATTELSGLKRRVSQMVSAIFGPRSTNLNQDMLVKLKAVYTLVEQLYAGTQHALATVSPSNQAPTLLVEVLRKLSVLPE